MSQEQFPIEHEERYEQLRSRVALYIRPEIVDELMERQIPAYDDLSLVEIFEDDPELAHRVVTEMFDFEQANKPQE